MNICAASHKSREDREVDLEIEFQFLADKVFLSEHDGYLSVPKGEELVSVTLVEGLTHQLNGLLLVSDECLLDV